MWSNSHYNRNNVNKTSVRRLTLEGRPFNLVTQHPTTRPIRHYFLCDMTLSVQIFNKRYTK